MNKNETLKDIFIGGKTHGKLYIKDICDDLKIVKTQMNRYINGKVQPKDKRFYEIIKSAKKILISKLELINEVEKSLKISGKL